MRAATEYARTVVDRGALEKLIPSLERGGYQVVGPVLRDGAIVYDTLKSLDDLPAGWTEEQQPGRYRLRKRGDGSLFGYTVGPQSWKKFLCPPEVRLFQVQRNNGTFHILEESAPPPRYALLGVRACELAAIEAQDRVLAQGRFADTVYRSRRQQAFIVAVNCTQSAATCFCASMQTGPRAKAGFDLALTEMLEDGVSQFVVETGSPQGAEILRQMDSHPASLEMCRKADEAVTRAAEQTRAINLNGLHGKLAESFDHPRWEDIARRCLTCGNCTLVCPTCFCTTVEDTSDVAGQHAARWRKWDSCFTQTFSYIHGGSVRQSAKSRYRQWLMHKLAFWTDQFGGSGCVGCGRCITWCPAAIDITEEVRAIREPIPVSTSQSREKDDGNT